VRRWAPHLDLVSPRDLERFEDRHIADSLRLVPLMDDLPEGPCIDVGSGAGLPGIPLAIVRPERHWRLLEPRTRRAGFLEEVVRSLGLACEVLHLTAEAAAEEDRLRRAHVLATARALAPPPAAARLIEPLVHPGGIGAIFVGPDAELPARAALWTTGVAIIRTESPEQGISG